MATSRIQSYGRTIVLIPPVYVGLSLVFTAILYVGFPTHSLWFFPANLVVSLFLITLGLSFVGMAFFQFKKQSTTKSFRRSSALVTDGCYRLTRNPMYLGLTLILLGISAGLGQPLTLLSPLFFFCVMNWMFIPYEEEKMSYEQGRAYLNYRNRVRRWL
ncbi:methyltransferase family protein [Celerinatantimonas sp. YJH-8]|uniref:methyltransferase family protein n=1 Tax=Celerinatantimonas sp. YJH-8 TaxID=3228714 RepID=UPI0038C8C5A0